MFIESREIAVVAHVLGSLFLRVGHTQTQARRPKRSRFTLGTSRSNPPAERSERGDVCWSNSAARYYSAARYSVYSTNRCLLSIIHLSVQDKDHPSERNNVEMSSNLRNRSITRVPSTDGRPCICAAADWEIGVVILNMCLHISQ